MKQMLIAYSCFAFTAMAAEFLWPAMKKPFFRRGLITDGFYVVINIGLRIAFTASIGLFFMEVAADHLPAWVPQAVMHDSPIWVQTVVVIVVLDFFFYWMHRLKHRWDWWYRLHETHHSPVEMDWFSSVRFHPFEKILDRFIYLFPLTFLGTGNEALFILALVDAGVATFSHSNTRLRLGPLNYLVVGPEMHRWHHAANDVDPRTNYGNNLSIFDWIFGTGRLHAGEQPKELGCGDPHFPEGNIVKQFVFAFRPFEKEEGEAEVLVDRDGSASG